MLPTAVHTPVHSGNPLKLSRAPGNRRVALLSCQVQLHGAAVKRLRRDTTSIGAPLRSISRAVVQTCSSSGQQHSEAVVASSSHRQPWIAGLNLSGRTLAAVALATVTVGNLLLVGPAAASETLSQDALGIFKHFLDSIAALGPWGPVLFVASVSIAEMIPLFPTQPVCLAGGLLFGPLKGAALVLLGVTIAAFNAFSISKGVGRSLAQKMISAEMNEGGKDSQNIVSKKLAEVQQTIERGSFWEQFAAIVVLRLTPVVPYSASNYILGLTPLKTPVFIGGTVVGMTMWSIMYASLGGASRALLENGADMGVLFGELAEKAGAYTSQVALVALAVAAVAGVLWLLSSRSKPPQAEGEQKSEDVEVDVTPTPQTSPQLGPTKIRQ